MRAICLKAGLLSIAALPLLASDFSFAVTFSSAIQTGNVQNAAVNEASGIAASRLNPNVLWVHDDSGNPAQVFPMTTSGANLGTYSISGASAIDWEDLAVGPGPVSGAQYLYVGDIGDNNALRASVSVYRVAEPVVSDLQSPISTSIPGAAKLTFAYPDGPRDAESLFVDPLTKDIYIISKRENPKHLYRAAYPQSTSGTTTLQLMTTFLTDATWLTAADISPDGNEIIVRSTGSTSGRMYVRPPGGSITDAFNSTPITIPLAPEPQGEAIGFDPAGRGYFTVSEGLNQPVYYFNRLPPPPGSLYWDSDGLAAGTYRSSGAGMGGSGTWNDSTLKWYNGSADVPWANGNDAVFWGTPGTVSLSAAQVVNSLSFQSSGYLLTGSTLTLGGPSIAVDAGVDSTIDSTLAGAAGLVKNGNGTLRLSQSNVYTGGTIVNSGMLVVANSTGSGTGAEPVSVNPGASLGGGGTIQGNLVSSGAVVPGEGVGTLHIGGSYTQAAAGTLQIELASAAHDQLAAAGAASLAGTLAVSLSGGFVPQAGDAFEILSASTLGGTTFSNVVVPSLAGGLAWSILYGVNLVTLSVTVPGDFNADGTVDAADYVVWRTNSGTQAGYDTWRSNFGNTAGSGAAAGGGLAHTVPEPALPGIAFSGILAILHGRRRVASQARRFIDPYRRGLIFGARLNVS
jgi:autotransporter-associated beta strand protein